MKVTVNGSAIMSKLHRFLPVRAHARPSLLGRLKIENPEIQITSLLYISNIYDCGSSGLMCTIQLDSGITSSPMLVAPIDQISLCRRHPIARELKQYRRAAKGRRATSC